MITFELNQYHLSCFTLILLKTLMSENEHLSYIILEFHKLKIQIYLTPWFLFASYSSIKFLSNTDLSRCDKKLHHNLVTTYPKQILLAIFLFFHDCVNHLYKMHFQTLCRENWCTRNVIRHTWLFGFGRYWLIFGSTPTDLFI